MKTQNGKCVDFSVNRKVKLAGLWTTLMLLYIYCDIFSTFRPGHLEQAIQGKMGPFAVSQGTLAVFGLLMIIPALMVAFILFAAARTGKWVSIIVGVVYSLVNIGNLAGETWLYYWLYGLLELAITIIIIVVSAKWLKEENRSDGA